MSNIVTLKSFPFDSIKQLNEESGQMEDDRLYAAEVFRKYFSKFLSNGVYFGHYKNYAENSMKVSLDTGLTIKVSKGAGIIEGADYELENDALFTLDRPVSGTRKDRVVVKFDNTLGTRETQIYIKQGNGNTPADLQRDENIYEICIAEVTVKSTSNIVTSDIKDTRLDKTLCGIVDSLVSVDGQELYEKFKQYIDTVTENLVRKDQDSVINGKLTVKNGVEADLLARKLTNEDLNSIKKEGFYYAAGGNEILNKPNNVDAFGMLCMRVAGTPYVQIIITANKVYRRYYNNSTWTVWSENYDQLNPQEYVQTAFEATKLQSPVNISITGAAIGRQTYFDGRADCEIDVIELNPSFLREPVPVNKGGTGLSSVANKKISCKNNSFLGKVELTYNPLTKLCLLYINTNGIVENSLTEITIGNVPELYRTNNVIHEMSDAGKITVEINGAIKLTRKENGTALNVQAQLLWFI